MLHLTLLSTNSWCACSLYLHLHCWCQLITQFDVNACLCSYRCVYCGPDSKHDANMVPDTQQQIDMLEYLNCQANIKNAIVGK